MQLTVRCRDPELERRIRSLADAEGISLNKAALKLLRKGAQMDSRGARDRCIGSRLDHLAGTWSDEEAEEMAAELEVFERIDEDLWR
jgi:hypothetical protein